MSAKTSGIIGKNPYFRISFSIKATQNTTLNPKNKLKYAKQFTDIRKNYINFV